MTVSWYIVASLASVAFPIVAMIWMWGRVKRVRDGAYREADAPKHEIAWEEAIQQGEEQTLLRASAPNDELIALGAKADQTHWPMTPP